MQIFMHSIQKKNKKDYVQKYNYSKKIVWSHWRVNFKFWTQIKSESTLRWDISHLVHKKHIELIQKKNVASNQPIQVSIRVKYRYKIPGTELGYNENFVEKLPQLWYSLCKTFTLS